MLPLILFIALGFVIYLLFVLREHGQHQLARNEETMKVNEKKSTEDTECCGEHLVCEKESLLTSSAKIEYYDDEELDVLSGKEASSYTEAEAKMLQDVFYTLRESDVAGWVRSLQLRNISLPADLREEALLIIRERRGK